MMATWTKRAFAAAIVLALGAVSGMSDARTVLDGNWTAVEAVLAGKPDGSLVGHRLRFEGDRFQITRSGKLLFGGRFETDPTSTPPAIDFHQSETPALRGIWLGIYELDGDRLTICDNAYDLTKPRPKSVDDCSAPGYVVLRFTRAK